MWFGKKRKEEWNVKEYIKKVDKYTENLEKLEQTLRNESLLKKYANLADSYREAADMAAVCIVDLRKQKKVLDNLMPPRNQKTGDDLLEQIEKTLEDLKNEINNAWDTPSVSMEYVERHIKTLISLIDRLTCA